MDNNICAAILRCGYEASKKGVLANTGFGNCKEELQFLEQEGYIEIAKLYVDDSGQFTLTKSGFEYVKSTLGE